MRAGSIGLRTTLTLLIVLACVPANATAQQGVVHLRNGGRVYGELIEVQPGDTVRLELADGTIRAIPWSEVDHVDEAASPLPAASEAPAATVPAASAAPPQPTPGPDDIGARSKRASLAPMLVLGAGGVLNARMEVDGESLEGDADFSPSFGGMLHFDGPLHPYFAIGLFGRILSIKTDGDDDRASVFELAVAPRARFPFAIGKQWGAAYVQLALGFGALDIPAVHSVASGSYELVPLRASTDTAFLVGASVGVQLLLSPHAGLVFDLGWQHHFFSKKMSVELIGIDTVQTVEADADYDGGQLMLSAGPLFAF